MLGEILSKCRFVFNTLESSGYECYAVGGCVRDILLKKNPHDIDFTTNATPDEILSCFKDYKTFELGKKYGTISVLHNGDIYEITTYRIDGAYSDSRHPETVEFSRNLKDDLARRDFTVNAMAMDKSGNIVDLYGGVDDLRQKLIRAVGNPYERFTEDALRIFRALRFSAKLGFTIDAETAKACHDLSSSLNKVHPQRIRDELSQLLISSNAVSVIDEYRDVFAVIFPEIIPCLGFQQNTVHHRYDVFTHILKSLTFAPAGLEIRLALLFHDIGKPACHSKDKAGVSHFKGHPAVSADIAMEILRRFAYPSDLINKVYLLIRFHDKRFERPRPHIRKILSELSEDDFKKLLTIQRCDVLAQSDYLRDEKLALIDSVEKEFISIITENACVKLSDLKVNGNDMMQLGFFGKSIGNVLQYLLEEVINERLDNEKNELIASALAFKDRIDK